MEKGGAGGHFRVSGANDRSGASVASPGASLRQIVTCDKVPGELSTGYPQLIALLQ